MNFFYLLVVFGIFACSVSQILLKISADRSHRSWLASMLNWRVITAYGIFFCSLFINITAMAHGVQLKDMPALESLAAIFVPLMSYLVLKEKFTLRKILTCILVAIGIVVFYS